MPSTLPLLEVLQQAATEPSPFSILQLGKALFTLSFFSLVTATFTVRAARSLKEGGPAARSKIDLSLFWGVFTSGVGLFHVFMGLSSTLWSVQLYGPIGPDQQWLVARGLMLATLAGAWGVLVLLAAASAWLWLRHRHARAVPSAA